MNEFVNYLPISGMFIYIKYFQLLFSTTWNVCVKRNRRVKTPFITGLFWPILQQCMRSVCNILWDDHLHRKLRCQRQHLERDKSPTKQKKQVWKSFMFIFTVLCSYHHPLLSFSKQDIHDAIKIMFTSRRSWRENTEANNSEQKFFDHCEVISDLKCNITWIFKWQYFCKLLLCFFLFRQGYNILFVRPVSVYYIVTHPLLSSIRRG